MLKTIMTRKQLKLVFWLSISGLILFALGTTADAAISGIGAVATRAMTSTIGPMAKLITAISYAAGMACGVAAIVKFWAYKNNPQQVQIGMPIVLLFVGAALLFIPSVFQATGSTLFVGGSTGGISGITSF